MNNKYPLEIWADTDLVCSEESFAGWQKYRRIDEPEKTATTVEIELTPEELSLVRYALLELVGHRLEQSIDRGYDEDLRKEATELRKLADKMKGLKP